MDTAEIKEAVDEQGRAWAEFRDENDKGLKADREKLAKLNARLDQLETALNRTDRGGTASDDEGEQTPEAKAFAGYLRKGHERLEPDEAKLLLTGDDTGAGYLAPRERIVEIIKGAIEFSPIRAIARVRTTSRRSIEIPKRTGVFSAVWEGELDSTSETPGLAYGLEEIPIHTTRALVDISNELLEDSEFNIEAELDSEFSEQFGVAEGTAFVNGNAVKRPEGFMTNADVGFTVSGSASVITDAAGQANGLIDVQHAIKAVYAQNATWVLNRTTLGTVRKIKDGNNNYIWQPGLASGIPNSILGSPYIEATDMPDEAADAFPMAFGDFRRAYTIVDRIFMSVLRDPFTQGAGSDVTRFIARRRVGGQVVLAEAIRKLKVST